MGPQPPDGFEPLAYLAVLYRWKWAIIAVTVVCAALGLAYLKTRTPLYQATARLRYSHQLIVANPLAGGTPFTALRQPNWGTASSVITGNQVGAAAGKLLDAHDVSAGYSVTVPLPPDVRPDAARDMAATVLSIDAVSRSPQTAAAAANAYAQAFVDHRQHAAQEQVGSLLAAVKAELLSFRTPSSRRGPEYVQLSQSGQALWLQLQTMTADYEVTVSAAPPPIPFYPAVQWTLAKFIALGLLLGTGMAFLLENLDTRPRDQREMAELLGMSVIGRLPPLSPSGAGASTLQVLANPLGRVAEGVRELRSNLSYASVAGEARTVLFSSPVGGEGKSVIACNLAVAMALAGRRVVIVDADLRHPSVHAHMQMANTVGLTSVLSKHADLADALVSIRLDQEIGVEGTKSATRVATPLEVISPLGVALPVWASHGKDAATAYAREQKEASPGLDAIPTLRVLAAGPLPPNPGEMAASERFGEVIGKLADTADIVIVDSPPLLEVGDTTAMALRADGLILVTNMNRVRWSMLEQTHTRLVQMPCRMLGLVVVEAKRPHKSAYAYRYGSVPKRAVKQART